MESGAKGGASRGISWYKYGISMLAHVGWTVFLAKIVGIAGGDLESDPTYD